MRSGCTRLLNRRGAVLVETITQADMVLQHPSKFDEIQFKILFTSASRPNLVPTATWKRREIDIVVIEKEVSKNYEGPTIAYQDLQ